MLSSKEMATLNNNLQVPVVIADIMDGNETLSDDIQYGLHEVISDLHPDSALLAIATGARKVAEQFVEASASMKVLVMECDRVIADYGSLWLSNAKGETISNDNVYETLIHTPEDLEGLAELLELCSTFLRAKDWQAAALLDILYIQAGAHAMIAEEFISNIDVAMEAGPDIAETMSSAFTAQATGNNVILFPVLQSNK